MSRKKEGVNGLSRKHQAAAQLQLRHRRQNVYPPNSAMYLSCNMPGRALFRMTLDRL